MKISIVIPVYNVKDYLPKCIDSILIQDCSDCEIILVDDGSTDGASGAICDRYEQEHPELIRVIHKENGGLGDARNVGQENARGDYVLFVDSDDYLASDTLEKLKAAADEYKCDVITFGFVVDTNGSLSEPFLENLPERTVFSIADNKRLLMSAPNAVVRLWSRQLLEQTGIKYPIRVWYEDIRTTLKLLTVAKSVVYLPETFYRYVVREGSITRNVNIERNSEIFDAFDDLLDWFGKNGLLDEYYDELCKLAVDHVLLAASVRIIKADAKHPLIERISEYMNEKFPDYMDNPYMNELSRSHKLLVSLLRSKKYGTVRLLFAVKDALK